MDVYVNVQKPSTINCWLGNREFNVTLQDKPFDKFMNFITNQAANYLIRYKKDFLRIIYYIFLDICEFNKVLPTITSYATSNITIASEPAVIVDGKLIFSLDVIKLFVQSNIKNVITFTEELNYNLESTHVFKDDKSTYLSKLIIIADHIATHYITSMINQKEPDYFAHSDFKQVGFTFSNVLDINVTAEKDFNPKRFVV